MTSKKNKWLNVLIISALILGFAVSKFVITKRLEVPVNNEDEIVSVLVNELSIS